MTEKGYIQATVLEDSVFYNESVECLVTTKASSQKKLSEEIYRYDHFCNLCSE